MVPASPIRLMLIWGFLGAGASLLWATRPQFSPEFAPGQEQSQSCLNNLGQISRAYALYARDFDGKIPLAVDPEDRYNTKIWRRETRASTKYSLYLQNAPFLHQVLLPYVGSPGVFHCPADQGWTVSRLSQRDPMTGEFTGLQGVKPSSFAKYGTSYYSWTIYGFELKTVAEILHPERKTVLFDGDLWHQSGGQERGGELFLDGHAASLTKAQHDAAAPLDEH